MENKSIILENIENKLMKALEKHQNPKILKDSINETKRFSKLYETEVEKCKQLNEKLIKLKFESKIAIEKEVIELKEEKCEYLAQIDRLNNELIELKKELNCLQSIRLNLEHKLSQISNHCQIENSFQTSISSQIMQINSKAESVAQYMSTIESFQNELKNSVENVILNNCELNGLLSERNSVLLLAQNEISSLRQQLLDLNSKSFNKQNPTNHEDLQLLQINKENQLQKEEILKLKQLLKESRNENKFLSDLLTEINVNPIGINRNDSLDVEVLSESMENN